MTSRSFFICKNVKEIQTKNPFDKILSLNFDLGPFKVNTYHVRLNQFCKGLTKRLIYVKF
jgi:alpha-D-ribose 1-methylphosphonate 5-phosphate C-P lyase